MRSFLYEIKRYLTPVNTVIILLNIVCFIAQTVFDRVSGSGIVTYNYSLAWWKVFEDHEYYRLLTHMFLHGGISHIFNNMLVLGFIGSTAERLMGRFKYAMTYLSSGLVAGLASAAYNRICYNMASESGGYYHYSLGASGAVFGVAGALLWIIFVHRGRIAGISLRQIVLFMALSIYAGIASTGIDNAAHIAGALFGIVSGTILYRPENRY